MEVLIRNEWLANLLLPQRNLLTEYWIENIRSEGIVGYETINDEQLREDLPQTVDSMIYAFRTGDTEGARKHSVGVIRRRLANGFLLPDLQMSLHALETAVMRVVKQAQVGTAKELEALKSASGMYYIVALIAADVYEQLRTEQQERFTTTYEFGIMLSRNLDLDALLDTSVSKVAEYSGGASVAILLAIREGDVGEVGAYYNLDQEIVEAMPDIIRSLGCGVLDAGSTDMRHAACWIPDVRVARSTEKWSVLLASHERLSMMCAPLLAKQRYLGSLVLLWSDEHTVSDPEKDFLLAMAGHIANAVQNAILYEEARGKRELDVLLNASRLFASSLDTQDILHMMAKMATEAVRADLAIVFTLDPLQKRSRIAYYAGSRRAASAVQVIREIVAPEEENGFSVLGPDFAGGKPIMFRDRNDFSGRLQPLAETIGSGLAVPLRQKDMLLGAFAIISFRQDAFDENDLLLAISLADLAAVAIENARLYEYERNIAETLQRTFLPSSLPAIEGYEIAAYYRSAMAEAEVGGDFYDVFATAEGRVCIIIGDVSGKGLKAAVPTAMGKYTVRAYAAENSSPGNVLARFNRIFYENVPDCLFMTAFYATLDKGDNAVTYSSAGHNPPLLYSSASGRVKEINVGGLCLGVIANAEYVETTIYLQPGDVLLLYTDGATDVKRDDERLEIAGLEQLFLASVDESAEQIMRNVSDGICSYSRGRLADDVALVVLKRQDDGSSGYPNTSSAAATNSSSNSCGVAST
ncbi:MAG: SpoIIE family protein phosphatase [Armatimonadetes bacterium]|nr:SpoIIE family protein phosphatase [Armatimonadota bacterium]